MKNILKLLFGCFIFLCIIMTFPTIAETKRDITSTKHIKLLNEFKKMYEEKHFKPFLFDVTDGYLQTAVADNEDKMPLSYFVKYNNMWWFQIISKVDVPSIAYDSKTGTGFIILNIYYGKKHILRAMQYVKFKNNKISYIRTYGSPTFWNNNDHLIKLDKYGNEIWLTTGYNLDYSVKAASYFFDSPVGQFFAKNPETSSAVKRIKKSLAKYMVHREKE